ncbi:SpoIIE family protein phosphatase [Streptomyces sp. NPDC059402]|uniref:SpoIIE family protein phosphatase n=1 Tax=Streptomyces sp. NPDC059402 TaxID=3346822 RepID=UPI0036CEE46F
MNARLALLGTVGPGATESEIFRLALQHAVGELGGLGGMIHLRGPMSALRLVSAVGLPQAVTLPWEIIDQEGALAPARALHEGGGVWSPAGTGAPMPREGPVQVGGLAAVPLSGGDRSIGALSVVMSDGGAPTPQQWEFLRAVSAWTEERMAQAPPAVGPAHTESSGERLRRALHEVRVGSWEWDIGTGRLAWDAAALEVFGTRPEDFVGRIENWMKNIHPDDLAPTLGVAERAIRDHSVYEAEYRVRRQDGSYGWVRVRGRATYDEHGEPVRLAGVGWENDESRSARDALSRALRHMSDGFLAFDDEWRIIFANREAERLLGSTEDDLLGRVPWALPATRRIPDMESRLRKTVEVDEPAGFDVRMHEDRRYHLRLVPGPGGRTLYITDVTQKRRLQEERQAAERAASERADHVAKLTAALAKATTSRDVVDALAPRVLAPFAAVGLLVQTVEGESLHTVGAVGYDDGFLSAAEGLSRSSRGPRRAVIASGTPLFLSSVEELAAHSPDVSELPAPSGHQSWAFLPLTASGVTFGVCVLSFDRPRLLTDDERTLLTTITALVAQSLERAKLYDAEHTRSRELQRGLLPRGLPSVSACTAAARYLPAGQGMDVGGDWYDIIPLSGGQVALVVGDVMGHGLPEAATMGRLRTAVHTLAGLELPPDEIMSHLNDIVGGMDVESYVTCLYALYDPTTRVCSIVRAGHPPPAVVLPDGRVQFPKAAPDPPLGAAEPPFETVELTVPEDSLLVLYTDGLVESSTREMDQGMETLARMLSTAYSAAAGQGGAGIELEQLCDTLTAGLLPVGQQAADDAALLVARLHATPEEKMARWSLRDDPRAAGLARQHVREQLAAWGMDHLIPTTELLVSELVGNVVRHAKGPIGLRLLYDTELICEVYDGSLTMPRIRRATDTDEGGRGLQLITALSRRWGTRYTANGKCIWTEQDLVGAENHRGDPSEALELMFPAIGDFAGDLDALPFGDQEL